MLEALGCETRRFGVGAIMLEFNLGRIRYPFYAGIPVSNLLDPLSGILPATLFRVILV